MSYPENVTKKKSRRTIVAAVLAVLALCCGGGILIAATSGNKPPSNPGAAAASAAVQLAEGARSASAAPPATTGAAKPAAPTIADGTWTVGEDFPAGNYKATGAGDRCYWAIYTSGKNQSFDALIDNHAGGGNLRVTLKAGQDFETKRCGTWAKV